MNQIEFENIMKYLSGRLTFHYDTCNSNSKLDIIEASMDIGTVKAFIEVIDVLRECFKTSHDKDDLIKAIINRIEYYKSIANKTAQYDIIETSMEIGRIKGLINAVEEIKERIEYKCL